MGLEALVVPVPPEPERSFTRTPGASNAAHEYSGVSLGSLVATALGSAPTSTFSYRMCGMTTPDDRPVNVEETLRKIRTLIDSILGPSEGHHYEVVLQDDVGLTEDVRPQSGIGVLVLAGRATATATAHEPEIRVTEAEILETESRLSEYATQPAGTWARPSSPRPFSRQESGSSKC